MKKQSHFRQNIVFLALWALISACQTDTIQTTDTIDGQLYAQTPESAIATGLNTTQYPADNLNTYPFNPTEAAGLEQVAAVHLTVEEPMIVRLAPDVNADAFTRIPSGKPFTVLSKYIDWWLIDIGDGQTGWVNDIHTHVTGDYAQMPTADLPPQRFSTPTPLCTPQDVSNFDLALDEARSTLVAFFDLLSRKEYGQAAELYGGDLYILRYSNPLVDPKDFTTLFQHACEINGYQCFPVKRLVGVKIISLFLFEFEVEFIQPDGSLLIIGACCGGNETDQPLKSSWKYTVILDCSGRYWVMDLPQYIP